jgi:hypothetical protein
VIRSNFVLSVWLVFAATQAIQDESPSVTPASQIHSTNKRAVRVLVLDEQGAIPQPDIWVHLGSPTNFEFHWTAAQLIPTSSAISETQFQASAKSDSQGIAELLLPEGDREWLLAARDRNGRSAILGNARFVNGDEPLPLRLHPPAWVEIMIPESFVRPQDRVFVMAMQSRPTEVPLDWGTCAQPEHGQVARIGPVPADTKIELVAAVDLHHDHRNIDLGRWTVRSAAGETIRIDLSPLGQLRVRGRVTDSSNQSIANAAVKAVPQMSNFPAAIAFTNSEGEYELSGLSPGDFTVEVMVPTPASVPVPPDYHSKIALTDLRADARVNFRNVAVPLPPPITNQPLYSLKGVVVRKGDGAPVPGATVAIAQMAEGVIQLIPAQDGVPCRPQARTPETELFESREWRAAMSDFLLLRTDAAGAFEVSCLLSDELPYAIVAMKDEKWIGMKPGVVIRALEGRPIRVEFEPGNYLEVKIPGLLVDKRPRDRFFCIVRGALSGRDLPPQPLSEILDGYFDATVAAPHPPSRDAPIQIGPLIPGIPYRVLITSPSEGDATQSTSWFETDLGDSRTTIDLSRSYSGQTLVAVLRDTNGRPAANTSAVVRFGARRDGDPRLAIGAISDADGKVIIRDLPPGTHRLKLLRNGPRAAPG